MTHTHMIVNIIYIVMRVRCHDEDEPTGEFTWAVTLAFQSEEQNQDGLDPTPGQEKITEARCDQIGRVNLEV